MYNYSNRGVNTVWARVRISVQMIANTPPPSSLTLAGGFLLLLGCG